MKVKVFFPSKDVKLYLKMISTSILRPVKLRFLALIYVNANAFYAYYLASTLSRHSILFHEHYEGIAIFAKVSCHKNVTQMPLYQVRWLPYGGCHAVPCSASTLDLWSWKTKIVFSWPGNVLTWKTT